MPCARFAATAAAPSPPASATRTLSPLRTREYPAETSVVSLVPEQRRFAFAHPCFARQARKGRQLPWRFIPMSGNLKVLVTGGAGFIGSAFLRLAMREDWFARAVNLDKLTYAGNPENVEPIAADPRYRFVRADICDGPAVDAVFAEERPDAIIHFAAESHVDRAIFSPSPVIETNVRGTFTLLEAARKHAVERFVHVSTDEVYGDVAAPLEADERFVLNPSSPYSAAKAGSDLLALAYVRTYRLPVMVTRASNNYGPYQFPEKLIPLMITNALAGRKLPVYGDGRQIRDWLRS